MGYYIFPIFKFKIEEGNDYLQNHVNSRVFSLSQIKNKSFDGVRIFYNETLIPIPFLSHDMGVQCFDSFVFMGYTKKSLVLTLLSLILIL